MRAIEKVIFVLLLILSNSQVPIGNSINSCGKRTYNQPASSNDCVENGEICCYVFLTKTVSNTPGTTTTEEKKFCASSPSRIAKQDIKDEILEYTGYELTELTCNNSKYIKNIIGSLLLVLFILC